MENSTTGEKSVKAKNSFQFVPYYRVTGRGRKNVLNKKTGYYRNNHGSKNIGYKALINIVTHDTNPVSTNIFNEQAYTTNNTQ